MKKKTIMKERRAIAISSIITSIYLIAWTINLSNIDLKAIIPYIIINIFLTIFMCAFFIVIFGGLKVAEEKMILQELSQGMNVEIFFKKNIVTDNPNEDKHRYNIYAEKGAKFYAKLYNGGDIFLIIECKDEKHIESISYETFKDNFKFA